MSTKKKCPVCHEVLTPEEIAARECWSCGHDEYPAKHSEVTPSAQEWDTDDDEAMPNIISR